MPCYMPLEAWRTPSGTIQFKPVWSDPIIGRMRLPCGRCIGCRLERSRQWAVRCVHEASLHPENCFITLTFNPDSLASRENPHSLDVRDFQLFMKRLRKNTGRKIRFFHCGEYGDLNRRPHYHALLFGFTFPDATPFGGNHSHPIFTSRTLSDLWPYGFSTLGACNFETAAYVSRYVTKKVTGQQADDHYEVMNPDTGELTRIMPEYCTMSRKPGIGQGWIDKYMSDVYPRDYVLINGSKCKPPRYYDQQLPPEMLEQIKAARIRAAKDNPDYADDDRLAVKHELAIHRMKRKIRSLDSIS